MKRAIFFSQSPSDLKYILSLYEKCKNKYKVTIYVVGIKSNYLFLKKILPSIEIEYLYIPKIREIIFNPLQLIKIRILARRICLKNKGCVVYFFSRYIDYYTAFIVDNLKKNNKVIYIDSVYSFLDKNINYSKEFQISKILKSFYLFLIFFKESKFVNHSGKQIYYYHDTSLIVSESIDINTSIYDLYSLKPDLIESIKPKLVFFESGGEEDYFNDYQKNLKEVLDIISERFTVYIKPHPTHNYSKSAENYNIHFLPKHIPSEFLDLSEFSLVLGIESVAVALVNHTNKYSIMNCFEFNNDFVKANFKKYLDETSLSEIRYLDHIEQLNNV